MVQGPDDPGVHVVHEDSAMVPDQIYHNQLNLWTSGTSSREPTTLKRIRPEPGGVALSVPANV